jgi:hypothetical protein
MGLLHPKEELEKLGPARQMLVKICTEYPIHSDAYRKAAERWRRSTRWRKRLSAIGSFSGIEGTEPT